MKSCPARTCSVCGSELKPLFSSLQCFNDNCGKVASITAAHTAWVQMFGYPFKLNLPEDIEVAECSTGRIDEHTIDICYKLKGVEWYGAQVVRIDALRSVYAKTLFTKEANEVWARMRETRPVNFAALTKAGSWGVP